MKVSHQQHIFSEKLMLDSSKKIILICFDESSLKLSKNTFYCILKAIFVLKIFLVLSYHFGHIEKINTNIRLISKFMTSQPG